MAGPVSNYDDEIRQGMSQAPSVIVPDMTQQFNTVLSPDEEKQFQQWAAQRGATNDLFDYDLRGAWKGSAQEASNGHLPDTYKKPNHPTFSNQSQYNGIGGNVGGVWIPQGQSWSYQPSETNIKMHGLDGLQSYFKRVEPDVNLLPLTIEKGM